MVIMVFVIYAITMPLLFLALDTVVKKNLTDAFVDDVRIFARVFADSVETSEMGETRLQLERHLDSAVLGGRVVFGSIDLGFETITSALGEIDDPSEFKEDFAFGEHDDNVYFMSLPLVSSSTMGFLRFGFDEVPILEQVSQARLTIFYIMAMYFVAVVVLTTVLSSRIVRPIRRLKRQSRAIASGDYARQIKIESNTLELQELSRDLEDMRSELVGVNARLQAEMSERVLAEKEQRALEDQLRHSQRLESLGTLAGGVAHEFNNVLQPLILYTDLALEDLPDDIPPRQSLERVLKLAHRAKGLSQQILTFGRQYNESERNVSDIVKVVEEAIAMIKALFPATLNILFEPGRDIGPVLCNPAEIQQLLVNLCNNSFQALRDDREKIHITLKEVVVPELLATEIPDLRTGEYAVLDVTDTGSGMDEGTVKRVFEPFYTTQRVGEGTGLGLSVVHGIVMRHGGAVTIDSELGKGTKVRVYLPISDTQPHGSDNRTGNM